MSGTYGGVQSSARSSTGVRVVGIIVAILGLLFLVAGVTAYAIVSSTLADQHITVADDAAHFAGKDVKGPFTAYAQADVINKHATEIGGGKTYAELPQDDPNRPTVMDASFLQASLFTSVVAFGVAAFAGDGCRAHAARLGAGTPGPRRHLTRVQR